MEKHIVSNGTVLFYLLSCLFRRRGYNWIYLIKMLKSVISAERKFLLILDAVLTAVVC